MIRVQIFFIRVQIVTLVTVICCILNITIIIVSLEKRNVSIKEFIRIFEKSDIDKK